MALLAQAVGASAYDLVLALLNVVQTVALAYLAADRHQITMMRRAGIATRRDDPPRQTP